MDARRAGRRRDAVHAHGRVSARRSLSAATTTRSGSCSASSSPAGTWTLDDWYPDALPCIARLRTAGYRVCASGNTPASVEDDLRPRSTRSAPRRAGECTSPTPAFFARVVDLAGVEPAKIAYVGDRVDNDVGPAIAAGMVGVHVRRGPWGHLQQPPAEAIRIGSLDELPECSHDDSGGDRRRRACARAGRAARARRRALRLRPRSRRPLRRRRARTCARRRRARRGRPRRHRFAVPVRRRPLPGRVEPRPAARGLPAGREPPAGGSSTPTAS